MTKLHELLAVEGNLKGQADKTRTDQASTYDKKRHLFEKKLVTFTPNTEGAQTVTETQSDIQTTVRKELSLLQPILAKAIDASNQVAEANTKARADVIDENGVVILTNVPATSLLELEKRLAEVHSLVSVIPTLDPAKGFELDKTLGDGYYKARSVLKQRTKKAKKVLVKYEATDKHPAQTETYDEDVPVGQVQEQEWSGLITPAEKSELLNKVDTLSRAVRRARSRANDVEVDTSKKIGNDLLKYIFGQ